MLAVATPDEDVLLTINTALFTTQASEYSAFGVSTSILLWSLVLDALAWLFCSPISRHCLAL
ncbi:hypothetical protein OK016_16335 [Vibrio chagasii]|nr:hypothetical protein [Vibrio chagasii]